MLSPWPFSRSLPSCTPLLSWYSVCASPLAYFSRTATTPPTPQRITPPDTHNELLHQTPTMTSVVLSPTTTTTPRPHRRSFRNSRKILLLTVQSNGQVKPTCQHIVCTHYHKKVFLLNLNFFLKKRQQKQAHQHDTFKLHIIQLLNDRTRIWLPLTHTPVLLRAREHVYLSLLEFDRRNLFSPSTLFVTTLSLLTMQYTYY